MVSLVHSCMKYLLRNTRLQLWADGIQALVSVRRASFPVNCKMDWTRYLDTDSNGSLVSGSLWSILA